MSFRLRHTYEIESNENILRFFRDHTKITNEGHIEDVRNRVD